MCESLRGHVWSCTSRRIPLPPVIDTHSHLYEPEFDADRDDAIERARQAGVEHLLLPNINRESIGPMLRLCEQYPGYCHPMMGLHPEDVKSDFQDTLDAMQSLLTAPDPPYIAVGEVGLDFYWDETFRKEQFEAFEQQICWARDLRLPLVIHARKAQREIVEAMKRHHDEGLTGVFHCFGGSVEEAKELLQFDGFVLGIGGVLTFKKSPLPEVVRSVPLDRLVLETDCPYLAPVPHRGQRNESAFVADVLRKLADVLGKSVEEVEMVTTATAERVFPRLKGLF
ncbi:MAG: TatD family hydrolase [Bacteroidaceae bacterium]|nr:TatD family hydrolase [Bacteroidaceae bacterium]